ncbi:MAG: SGNH/GDSL hydrolase family protein, partial [Planctomycetota bacterium]
MLDVCRDHGAVPVLMTYPEFQGEYGVVNAAIRRVASEQEVLLVDHERAFQPHFERDGYETLMLNDHHPNLRGYQLMASLIDAALADAGHVPPVRADAAAGGARVPDQPPRLESGPQGRLILSGPAGWSWQLLIGRTTGSAEALSIGEHDLPLLDDSILALARLEPTFSGRFATDAPIEIGIPPRLIAEAGNSELAACLVLL